MADLRQRLSWHALGHALVDPRVDREVMARVGIYIYLAGGILGLFLLVFTDDATRDRALGATTVAAFAAAILMLVAFERISWRGFRLLAVLGTALISVAVWATGVDGSAVWSLYLAVVFYAVYFFDRRDAIALLVLIGLAYGTVGLADSTPLAFWLSTAGVVVGASALVWLVKERIRALIASLDEQARTDPLTGALNRRGVEERVEQELSRAARYRRPLALVVADIDGFKELNDGHGHLAGDRALQLVAEAFDTTRRESDHVARVGGDEFLILAPETDAEASHALAQRIQAAVQSAVSGQPFGLTLSFGAACYPADGDSLDDLYRVADDELYRAKALAAQSASESR